jgi:tRNA nucleotidyltransferase/poly(A) polymerase
MHCMIIIVFYDFFYSTGAYDIVFSEIDKFPNFTTKQKKEIKKNLEKDINSQNKHEKSAEAQQFKKLWVQSTKVSNNIAQNSRLSEAIISSIENSISDFPEKFLGKMKRMSNPYIETVISACKEALDTISETNIFCQEADKYRSLNGVCNNLDNKTFGAAGIAMRRFAAPAYADGK